MNKTAIFCALLAGGLGASAATFAADSMDDPWHFSVSLGRTALDNNRPTDNGDLYYGIGIGRFLNSNFSLDLEYDRINATVTPAAMAASFPGATFNDWDMKSTNLIGRYYFGENDVRPFVAFGAGYTSHRNIFSENSDLNVNLGVGVEGSFTDRLNGRAQLMYRFNHDNNGQGPQFDSFDDFIFSLGLVYSFGGGGSSSAAEPAAAAPEPVDRDSDGDGVMDSSDRCPGTRAGAAVDEYGCALDSDGDGVPNSRDKCPDTRAGAVVDLDGCEVEAVIELRGVHFDFDQATLKPEAIAILDEAAGLLNQHSRVAVEVAGHTDSVGSEDYNQGLSERRANAVRDYLVSKGVSASRLSARGYGESRPVASNDTEEGRAENRRTELVVLER